ncbi:MAG: EAL domain-containing protein [Lachnospiraceae bacterium]|nr:EAL domain-containing protein [Lachnospiraceae bacterium]
MAEIGIQFCGLALILLLIFFTYRRKSIGLHSSRSYHMALIAALICLGSDVISIYGLAHLDTWPESAVLVACRIYIVSLVYMGFLSFGYIASDALHRKVRWISGAIGGTSVLVTTAIVWFLPLYIHAEGEELYTYGPAVVATYIFAVTYVLATVTFAIASMRYMNRHRTISVLAWMGIWLLAAVIQYFNNNLPLVGFATALGLTILFADLENPDVNIDRETGTFTAHALMSYMIQQFEEENPFAMMNIVLGTENQNFTRVQMRSILLTAAKRLDSIPNTLLFRNVAREYILLFRNREELETQYPKIRELLQQPIATDEGVTELHPYYIILPDSGLVTGADEIFAFHGHFLQHDPEVDYRIVDAQEMKRIREEVRIRSEISEALREDRLEVYLHPIFSVEKQRFTSAEALARIRYRDGGLMMPGAFIPVAEQSDQIIHIGETVFRKSCQFLAEHDMEELGIEYIEINLSVAQCQRPTLAAEFIEIMDQYQVDPRQINLEITESGSLKHRKILLTNMQALIDRGVRFSLDDFGTGESNLDYIMNMPVEIIKFDRTLTQSYFTNQRTKYVIDSIIEMIKGLELEIVSEGVETKGQYHTMMEKDIDYIQGYYFAKPMSMTDFVAFVKNYEGEADA